MRTWLIIIIISIFCIGIAICESMAVNGFCDELYDSLNNYNGSNADEIYDLWDSRKQKIFVFVNHNYFDELEKELFELKNSSDNNKKSTSIKRVKKISHDLRDSIKLSVGNLF